MIVLRLHRLIQRYVRDVTGTAAIESALLFPTLIMMLVSMVDIGNGLLSNQKLINAAQTTADLIARESNPTLKQRSDAILAGQLAMSPYSLDSYQYNASSFSFASDGSTDLVWQESNGLSLDGDAVGDLSDLGGPGEGVLVVVVKYIYTPFFTGFVLGPIHMEERAYVRGRKSAVIGLPL